MTPKELQSKIYNFSTSYFLPDLRKDRSDFYALTMEDLQEYPICIVGYVLNLYMDGQLEKANQLLNFLPEDNLIRMGISLVNPAITWKDFANIIQLYKLKNQKVGLLVLTAGRPNLINGFNDFCRLTPFLINHKNDFIEGLDILYGKDCSSSLYNLILAETYYQQNRLTDSELLLSQTINDFNKKNEDRFIFTILFLEYKIFIANGINIKTEQFTSDIQKRIGPLGKSEFSNNINAVQVQLGFYTSDYKTISDWFENDVPDEIGDFNMLDLYRYMVKIRCYIILEQYNSAISLIEKLRPLVIEGHRHTDLCELDLLLSITLYASNKKELALEALERCLKIAKRRNFNRLIADEGIAVFPILLDYIKLKGDSPFLHSIIESNRRMAILYPRYLQPRFKNNEQFSQQEIDILYLLQQGKNQEEIGEYFFISVNTVKYHLKKIYTKLNAENANQAVWNAKLLGLIR